MILWIQSFFFIFVSIVCCVVTSEIIVNELHNKDFAAEVIGVSLQNIDDSSFDLVHQLLTRYKVLVVRNQTDLTPSGQKSFSQRFGTLHVHLESSSHLPGFKDVNVVSNIVINGTHIGLYGKHVETYHSDLSWSSLPAKYTVLHSVILPDGYGDTEFVNTHAAYDSLPDSIKQKVKGRTGGYCYLKLKPVDESGNAENLKAEELDVANVCATHPLVTMHPLTGLKSIFANPTDTSFVHGMTRYESDDLLSYLFQHTAQDKFVYRHQYRDHDVILWDNRGKYFILCFCGFNSRVTVFIFF
jgi:taurine dioxygenase